MKRPRSPMHCSRCDDWLVAVLRPGAELAAAGTLDPALLEQLCPACDGPFALVNAVRQIHRRPA